MLLRRFTLSLIIFSFSHCIFAQSDTLRVTLSEAENTFLKNNLYLLAEQFNIQAADARIIQSKAYPNPIFSADLNAYDPQHDMAFHIGPSGQKSFAIQQLILLGGKRKSQIDIAKSNRKIAEAEFADLLRNLSYQLHQSFFTLHRQLKQVENLDRELDILNSIIKSYEEQTNKGNIALKDLVRLKSVYLRFNNDRSELNASIIEQRKEMSLLLQVNSIVTPSVSDNELQGYTKDVPLGDVINQAMANRPDLIIATADQEIAKLNLRLQKQMRIPDVAFNASYDQRGGAFFNQYNVGFSMPLPIWDRNKGNIKIAESQTQEVDLYAKQKQLEVENESRAAWQNLVRAVNDYSKTSGLYSQDFEAVFVGVNENFRKGNIGLLEFVDFFESYTTSRSEVERVRLQLALAASQLNYATGTKFFQ
jgi:cobalt-zinc-cadmium efflux system outer membrane protein